MVSMMFCMHYAFENEEKAKIMLRNVAGAAAAAGEDEDERPTFIDSDDERPTFADSDDEWDPEKPSEPAKEAVPPQSAETNGNADTTTDTNDKDVKEEETDTAPPLEWGNSIYRVQFPSTTPRDGIFRPPFGWKYLFHLNEAVETVPEYVVPWESFRGLAEDFNLELQYRMEFGAFFEEEGVKGTRESSELAERMGVKSRNDELLVGAEEMEAAGFYHAFCFYKV